MSLLEVTELSVAFYRRRVAVDGVTTLDAGQRLGIIGESGSGKTVTALAVLGLLPENAAVTGSLRLAGRELIGLDDAAHARLRGDLVSMVFQEPMTALDPTMRVGRQVAEVLRLHAPERSGTARAQVIDMLGRVGLADAERVADSFPHQLLGRAAAALPARDGPDQLARPGGLRRADHRAGRHGAGPGSCDCSTRC